MGIMEERAGAVHDCPKFETHKSYICQNWVAFDDNFFAMGDN